MQRQKKILKKVIQPKITEQKSTQKKNDVSVEAILTTFKSNLSNVDFFFKRFSVIAEDEDIEIHNNAVEYITTAFKDAGVELKEKDDQNETYENKLSIDQISNIFSESQIKELGKILKKTPKLTNQNFKILSSSSFLMLNNYFEYLIADLLSYYYNKFKNTLNSKEFKVSLKEISEYESIEDLEKYLILKEVETMLVELSFDGLLNHFKTHFKISLNDEIINWDIINECRERRHLIVHNASVVNKKYISRTNNPENKKIGDKISITKQYFQDVYNEIKLAGLLLTYECWGSWDKEKATKAINEILNESFEYLIQKKFIECDKITTYVDKIQARNDDEENILMRIKFNKCIALKKLDKKIDLNKILLSVKVGTSTPIFKLAHAILSDKNDSVIIELIEKSFKLKEIDQESYSDWPLFEFIRVKKTLNKKVLEKLKNQ